MDIRRFYIAQEDICGNQVTISGDEFWHLTKVLRYKLGYSLIVCNNIDGNDYLCELTEISKDFARAEVKEIVPNECKTKAKITLYQALPKGDKADFITQKAVELGVSDIVFFNSDYVSEKKFNIERLNKINVEACKQCGRSRISNIKGLLSFDQMLCELDLFDKVILCYENEKINSIKSQLRGEKFENIALIVGSEGGFSEQEVEKAKQKGAEAVTLGSRILRCETASIVVCGVVLYELGEMDR